MTMLGKLGGRNRVHKVLARNGYGKGAASQAAEGMRAKSHNGIASELARVETETHAEGNAPKRRMDRKSRASGGKLTTKERNALSSKSFVFPKERKYPIEDPNHARNALARVSQHGSPEQKEKVREAVHRKYPSIGKK